MSEWFGWAIRELNLLQRTLNAEFSSSIGALDESGIWGMAFVLLLSFIYGVVHAVGPGHGKAVVAGYFLHQDREIKSAFKIGYLVAIIHALSALLLTFVIYYLLDVIFTKTFNQAVAVTTKISGVMIIGVGIYLAFQTYKEWRDKEKPVDIGSKSMLATAFTIGVVPCPGVMTVLLFSIMAGYLFLGILAAIFMSIGMGLTISLAGIITVKSKSMASQKSMAVINILRVLSPALVIFVGVILLV